MGGLLWPAFVADNMRGAVAAVEVRAFNKAKITVTFDEQVFVAVVVPVADIGKALSPASGKLNPLGTRKTPLAARRLLVQEHERVATSGMHRQNILPAIAI